MNVAVTVGRTKGRLAGINAEAPWKVATAAKRRDVESFILTKTVVE